MTKAFLIQDGKLADCSNGKLAEKTESLVAQKKWKTKAFLTQKHWIWLTIVDILFLACMYCTLYTLYAYLRKYTQGREKRHNRICTKN